MDPDLLPLVIDVGSGLTKCGFGGDDSPRSVFPSIVGRPKGPGIMVGMDAKDCFVGDEAQAKRGILKLKYPVEHGLVTNWNDFEKILHHTFYYELRVTPEEHPLLMTISPHCSLLPRWKNVVILFETFNVPGLFLAPQPVLALHASGRVSGIAVDLGDGVSHSMAVYEGHAIPSTLYLMNLAGRDVTEYFVKILSERGYEMTTSHERLIVKDIKEKLCFVSSAYGEDLERAEATVFCEIEYELPDGSKMTVGNERFRAPEILFQPSMIGSELPGLHQFVANTIQLTDLQLRPSLSQNIVMSGGSSMFDELDKRLGLELTRLLPNAEMSIHTPRERAYSQWIGGSILSSLSSFLTSWITKDEYDEMGADLVRRKCF